MSQLSSFLDLDDWAALKISADGIFTECRSLSRFIPADGRVSDVVTNNFIEVFIVSGSPRISHDRLKPRRMRCWPSNIMEPIPIELDEDTSEPTESQVLGLIESSGVLDFWNSEPDLYTDADGEAI